MKLLPLDQLGPHELPDNRVRFGFLLLWVSARDGNSLFVKVIQQEADQFLQAVPPKRFRLTPSLAREITSSNCMARTTCWGSGPTAP